MATRLWLSLVVCLHAAGACGGGGTLPDDGPVTAAQCPAEDEAMMVVSKSPSGEQVLARFSGQGRPGFLAHAEEVYWVTYAVQRAPLLDVPLGPTTIEAFSLAIGGTGPRSLWRQERPGYREPLGRLWASGSDLVWMDYFPSAPPTTGTIHALPRTGGEARIVVDRIDTTGPDGALSSLGADDESLYISPISPVGISAVSRATGQITRHIARPTAPKLAAFDGAYLYWVEGDSLWRARRDGGDPQLLASEVAAPDSMAVHGGIAWLVPGTGGSLSTMGKRLLRVATQGTTATCTAVSWPEGGRYGNVIAGVGGAYLSIREPAGRPGHALWQIGSDGRTAWRVRDRDDGLEFLLAARADGLLLARSSNEGWTIARLPRQP